MSWSTSPAGKSGALTQLSGGMLLVFLAFGPLAYACTRATPLQALTLGLHLVFGIWLLGLLNDRRWPGIHPVPLIVATGLIIYAWLRLWFFQPAAVSAFTSSHFARIYDRWPESIILRTPTTIASLVSGLLMAFLVATDLARSAIWRRWLLFTMVGAGAMVVILGLSENAMHALGIYWEIPKNHMPSPFFGPFYHFTSAGAFLNLTWPIAVSLAFWSFNGYVSDDKPLFPVLLWSAVGGLILLGHAGHVSRFPQVIAGAILVAMATVFRPWANLKWSWRLLRLSGVAIVVSTCALLWVVARTGRLHDIGARWHVLNIRGNGQTAPAPPARELWPQLMRDDLVVYYDHGSYFLRDRGACYLFATDALMERPIFGYGPGGWMAAVSELATDPVIATFYLYLQFTHEDYLQTLIEWGIAGGILWAILIAGALRTGFRHIRISLIGENNRTDSPALIVGALASVIAVLVQSLIDFPLQIPANALYACVLLGICWSSAIPDPSSASFHKIRP